jgi:hypothetical protein
MSDNTPSPLSNVITIDDERIKSHLDRIVRAAWRTPAPAFAATLTEGLSRTSSLAKIQFSSHVACQSPLRKS